ncbi:MAG: 2-C-methyl-D-erythritol 2,4-cyclodiphosphate synthase [Algisphaera sp.]
MPRSNPSSASTPFAGHPRVGHGFDLHRLEPGHDLVVCGMTLDHDRGCVAHSDGDVVYHAVTDALLGALGEDDIGQLFPDTDPAWKNASSDRFVSEAVLKMRGHGYEVGNIDITLILERPKLSPHKATMRRHLAELLGCAADRVNLKGKTHEKVDALGENRAIACHVVVMLVPDPQAPSALC